MDNEFDKRLKDCRIMCMSDKVDIGLKNCKIILYYNLMFIKIKSCDPGLRPRSHAFLDWKTYNGVIWLYYYKNLFKSSLSIVNKTILWYIFLTLIKYKNLLFENILGQIFKIISKFILRIIISIWLEK